MEGGWVGGCSEQSKALGKAANKRESFTPAFRIIRMKIRDGDKGERWD